MTQTIEQLTARVRELEQSLWARDRDCDAKNLLISSLEEENARLKREDFSHERIQNDTLKLQNRVLYEKMIEAQAYAEQLREALEIVGNAPLVNDRGMLKYGISLSEMRSVEKAIALPHDTSALDAYVGEKVKEAKADVLDQVRHFKRVREQRDLAVEALEDVKGCFDAAEFEGLSDRIRKANVEYGSLADLVMRRLSPALATVEHALSAIKESEGK